jgi:branched-chain amino acid transport system ATP-binding protein
VTADGPGAPVLEVIGLEAGYQGSTVLTDVSISLAADEIVAVVGPNGAGKSTLLGTLSGLVRVRHGRILLHGRDFSRAAPHQFVRAGVVHVPEGRQVFPSMTVAENMTLGAFVRRKDAKAVAERRETVLSVFPRLAERLGQNAASLSGGEQQMLAIARGLMGLPSVLMIDEPTLGLAPILVERLIDHLKLVRAELGVAVLIAEQNLYLVRALADRAYTIQRGRAQPLRMDVMESSDVGALLRDYDPERKT